MRSTLPDEMLSLRNELSVFRIKELVKEKGDIGFLTNGSILKFLVVDLLQGSRLHVKQHVHSRSKREAWKNTNVLCQVHWH